MDRSSWTPPVPVFIMHLRTFLADMQQLFRGRSSSLKREIFSNQSLRRYESLSDQSTRLEASVVQAGYEHGSDAT